MFNKLLLISCFCQLIPYVIVTSRFHNANKKMSKFNSIIYADRQRRFTDMVHTHHMALNFVIRKCDFPSKKLGLVNF